MQGKKHREEFALKRMVHPDRNFYTFYHDVIRKPQFFLPFVLLSIMAYWPSLVNTKRQFEDFNIDLYYGNSGNMRTGRWWMWLIGRSFGLTGNDLGNKYLGLLFLMMGGILIACSFYCLSKRKGLFQYTLAATTTVIFPLINEIWSYNTVNLLVSMNTFYCGLVVYSLLRQRGKTVNRLLLASIPFVLISSSYESGLFQYVTLVLCICAYLCMREGLRGKGFFLTGAYFAVPLILGTGAGLGIGHLISLIGGIPYEKYGDTGFHWASETARAEVFVGNFDRYILRALVYVPITIFVFAVLISLFLMLKALVRKRFWTLLSLVFALGSIFLLSVLQGSHLTYRAAQTVTVFTAFIFYLTAEWSEGHPELFRRGFIAFMGLICVWESSFLLKVNLMDYQIASNDEDLVRQLGYDLTAHHRGKEVIFTGHTFDLTHLPSRVLLDQIVVDTSTPNGHLYDELIRKLNGGVSAEGMKYFETNLWSVLYLTSNDAKAMEMYFSFCGYDIHVVPSDALAERYPEAEEYISSREIQVLEIVDLGNCVIVGI